VANSPREFVSDLKRFNAKVELVVSLVVKETAKSIRNQVAARTPINTGRASASWNVCVGTPNFRPKPASYNNPGGAALDGQVNLQGFTLGRTIHVANGVPYIGDLNAGSSLKAPAGFVEASVQTLPLQLPAIVTIVRRQINV